MISPLQKWLKLCFNNLMLVALLGITLRYKIAFPLPFIDQRYLLHGHSHFAFAGWLTQVLMVLLVAYLAEQKLEGAFEKYRLLLYGNLFTAYGMLITFPFQGYGLFSISFSVLSIFVSYMFAVRYWIDLNRLACKTIAHKWLKAAVLFNALSSLGVFGLAIIMATKTHHPNIYLASIYFYLHFQYNGWFFFACMGLFCIRLLEYGVNSSSLKKVYLFFVIACIPAYILSVLWLRLSPWVYALLAIVAFLQLVGWFQLLRLIKLSIGIIKARIPVAAQRVMILPAVAVTIKLLLQAFSVVPSLSKMAFGFRPIVIGYLHLVLLGIITLFIAGYVLAVNYISVTRLTIAGLVLFAAGIVFNETLLMIQGIADLGYKTIPYINHLLLLAAVLIFAGIVLFNCGFDKSIKDTKVLNAYRST